MWLKDSIALPADLQPVSWQKSTSAALYSAAESKNRVDLELRPMLQFSLKIRIDER